MLINKEFQLQIIVYKYMHFCKQGQNSKCVLQFDFPFSRVRYSSMQIKFYIQYFNVKEQTNIYGKINRIHTVLLC